MMISVLVATKDRPNDIKRCLTSILQNTFHAYEVIIIDQSHTHKTRKVIHTFKHSTVRYISCLKGGKSYALNVGIKLARGTILAFTDDDCLVDKSWLKSIYTTFLDNTISGAFGRTLPHKPQAHANKICPCIFDKRSTSRIQTPVYHAIHIGFGNNMAFRTSIFDQIGGFNTLLGPGSIGSGAEDAEFTLRSLTHGIALIYDPTIVIYHNKWIAKQDMYKQSLSYMCGEMACYTLFALKKYPFAANIIRNNIRNSLSEIHTLVPFFKHQKKSQYFMNAYKTILIQFFKIRGVFVGLLLYTRSAETITHR